MPSVSLAGSPVSFSDLQQYPEDGRQYELYDGELVELPAPIPLHQVVVRRAFELLVDYERAHGGLVLFSPIDVVFDEYNVLQPDVLFFVAERVRQLDLTQAFRTPPDLVVEVLSPATSRRDRGIKMQKYGAEGVREYWLIDPERTRIEIYTAQNGAWAIASHGKPGAIVSSPLLDGLRFDSERLF